MTLVSFLLGIFGIMVVALIISYYLANNISLYLCRNYKSKYSFKELIEEDKKEKCHIYLIFAIIYIAIGIYI